MTVEVVVEEVLNMHYEGRHDLVGEDVKRKRKDVGEIEDDNVNDENGSDILNVDVDDLAKLEVDDVVKIIMNIDIEDVDVVVLSSADVEAIL